GGQGRLPGKGRLPRGDLRAPRFVADAGLDAGNHDRPERPGPQARRPRRRGPRSGRGRTQGRRI
ncbi:MAG: hypothetical protein AVDCRST_MAG02-1482, partial [uncultured Rubrobacteraceae bacterium]